MFDDGPSNTLPHFEHINLIIIIVNLLLHYKLRIIQQILSTAASYIIIIHTLSLDSRQSSMVICPVFQTSTPP
jgi:hypothetical protein